MRGAPFADEMAVSRAAQLAATALVCAAVPVTGCGAKGEKRQDVSEAVNEEGVSLALCGSVALWAPPIAGRDGVLAIDDRTWPVAAEARLRGVELLAQDAQVCVTAGLDTEGRIDACQVVPRPPDPWTDAGR